LVSKWEKVGPVNFTALVHRSPTRIVATTDHGYLYSTTDDGTTWQRQEVSDTLDLEAISFGDSLHGMMLSLNNYYMPFEEYRLVVTTDGGATWDIRQPPVFGATYLACIGADTAIIADNTGNIYRSTDGGGSWNEQYKADTSNGYGLAPSKLKFLDAQRGFLLCGYGVYVETTDAGVHWTLHNIDSAVWSEDIDFYDQNIGVIGASGAYAVTTDGGANWAVHIMPHNEVWNDLRTVGFFNANSFFAFGDINGLYYTSNDLGATLTPIPFWEANDVNAVVRTSSGGWLANGGGWVGFNPGDDGLILRGTPEPEVMTPQWTVLDECPAGGPVSLHATTGAMLQCAAGSYPLLSTDSGIFWHVTDTHHPGYGAIHFPSPDTGYLYIGGTVYGNFNLRTLDSGRSWKQADISGYINGATFGSADTGYGLMNTLVRTIEGGVNWEPDTTISFSSDCPYAGYRIYRTSMISIAAPDALDVFITVRSSDTLIVQPGPHYYDGEKVHFAVYKTSDAGATWVKLANVPILSTQPGIYFRNALLGFLTSDSGRLFRTSDGGNNWSVEQPAPIKYSFNSINFFNDNIGFLTLDTEAVMTTTDAGLTWAWLPIPTNREEIFARQIQMIKGPGDTVMNLSGMSTQQIFFPDSSTVLISFARSLIYTPSTGGQINGADVGDYGFYRGKLNLPLASVTESPYGVQPALDISIYPNPARDEARVKIFSANQDMVSIQVLDMLGRMVSRARSESGSEFSLDLQALPNGIYMVRCIAGEQSVTRNFTVTR
ncbi:MAG: YCF48-related protein, partial [Candidatus Kapaibacterium sp.]